MMMRHVGGTILLLATCLLAAAGCGTEPATPAGVTPVALTDLGPNEIDRHRTLGDPVQTGNLTVWPVYTDNPIDIGEFLTLQEAEARKVAVIRELGGVDAGQLQNGVCTPDEGSNDVEVEEEGQVRVVEGEAEVARVVIENKGELPILVLAGTIIDGGNQDRQIGQDFVIAAGATVDVDAFCVEQGRWGGEVTQQMEAELAQLRDRLNEEVERANRHAQGPVQGNEQADAEAQASDEASRRRQRADELIGFTEIYNGSFVNAPAQAFSALRVGMIAPKVVRVAGQYEKDQGKVWQKVTASNEECETQNGTDTLMGALTEVDEKTAKARAAYETAIRQAFDALASRDNPPVGFAYAINGAPVTVRAFAHPRILRSQLPLFVKAMAIEAQMVAGEPTASKRATTDDVIEMVRGIQAATQAETVRTRASNVNVYFSNNVGYNGSCQIEPGAIHFYKYSGLKKPVIVTEDWTAK